MEIRIILVDDHAILREGVKHLLETQPDMRVVGSFASGRSAVEFVAREHVDVAIVDMAMPELNGIEIVHRLQDTSPDTQILMLSMHSNPEHVYRALRAGAQGYVVKGALGNALFDAVRAVHGRQRYLSEVIDRNALDRYFQKQRTSDPLDWLSVREREVLQLTVEGRTIAETAQRLGISPKSVETYRGRVTAKLGIADLPALVKFAIRHGITSLE
ncbi:MAG: DNA-binding response regulator [Betaproteobacteria bacterium RIFCSPLOWO2_12_FULL_62_58]|nr:MAG: DNA-binding response regulator [Betaproteobacteria bacterium RIFCSPLOWO2_12_FULL_62_58]